MIWGAKWPPKIGILGKIDSILIIAMCSEILIIYTGNLSRKVFFKEWNEWKNT